MEKKKLSTTYKLLRALGFNYSEEELKAVYIFNQMNAAQNFNTVNLSTSTLTDEQRRAFCPA